MGVLSIDQLAALGVQEILAAIRDGKLSASQVGRMAWMGAAGVRKYRALIRAGYIAREDHANERVSRCMGCNACTETDGMLVIAGQAHRVKKHSCGPMLAPGNGPEGPTCGCLVALTVFGHDGSVVMRMPAGKTAVDEARARSDGSTAVKADEAVACPRGHW